MNSEKSPLCVFLNGLPGAGKSTYARRTIAGEAGWLSLDIDQIRELLGITAVDFREAGEEVRPLALALLRTQLAAGRNVVIPPTHRCRERRSQKPACAWLDACR
ncbi:AAA family ATPase [Naumannella halotolerans]|uniref:AAA family ATPase n=1 Tax=Naumannella halotolerans TaxID=993414 RepID=UPI00370D379D